MAIPGVTLKKACQHLLSINNYMTKSEIDKLKDSSVNDTAKLSVVTFRASRLSIINPSQQTIKSFDEFVVKL